MSARLKAVEPRRDLRSAPALRRPKKDEPSYAYRDELPFFVNRRSAKNAWWNVMPSGDYFADYKTGEEYAAAFGACAAGDRRAGSTLAKYYLRCMIRDGKGPIDTMVYRGSRSASSARSGKSLTSP